LNLGCSWLGRYDKVDERSARSAHLVDLRPKLTSVIITDNHNQSVTFLGGLEQNKQAKALMKSSNLDIDSGHPFGRPHGGRCWQFRGAAAGARFGPICGCSPDFLSRVFSQQTSQQFPHSQSAEMPLTVCIAYGEKLARGTRRQRLSSATTSLSRLLSWTTRGPV
jgi:hypothetical protein